VLEEAARFCRDVLLPLNRSGDEEGCHLENGVVRTPQVFRKPIASSPKALDVARVRSRMGWSGSTGGGEQARRGNDLFG
jgi:hypothetical protein